MKSPNTSLEVTAGGASSATPPNSPARAASALAGAFWPYTPPLRALDSEAAIAAAKAAADAFKRGRL